MESTDMPGRKRRFGNGPGFEFAPDPRRTFGRPGEAALKCSGQRHAGFGSEESQERGDRSKREH